MHTYPSLLEPYDFGSLALLNRMVMGAMHTRIETLDRPLARQVQFFRERAGQIAQDEPSRALAGSSMRVETIGGARFAAELDAARAIEEALRLAHAF